MTRGRDLVVDGPVNLSPTDAPWLLSQVGYPFGRMINVEDLQLRSQEFEARLDITYQKIQQLRQLQFLLLLSCL